MAAMVVQLGFAIIPLGRLSTSSGLTSETTSGTSGSLRHAEELSTTTAPAAANLGAYARGGGTRGEHSNVNTGVVGRRHILYDDVLPLPGQGRAGATRGREETNRLDRELTLLQQGAHDSADLAGGADDGDIETTHGVLLCWCARPYDGANAG